MQASELGIPPVYREFIVRLANESIEDCIVDDALDLFAHAFYNAVQCSGHAQIQFLAVAAFCLACSINDQAEYGDDRLQEYPDRDQIIIRRLMTSDISFVMWCHPNVAVDMASYLHAFCTLIGLTTHPRLIASYIVNNILLLGLCGKKHCSSIAAIAVIRTCELLSLHTGMTQQDFCSTFQVSLTSFRKLNRQLVTYWRQIIPEHLWPSTSAFVQEYPQPTLVLSQYGPVQPCIPAVRERNCFANLPYPC